jgi:thiamine transport system substrate-binding protein
LRRLPSLVGGVLFCRLFEENAMIRRFACLATLIALLAACAAQPSTAPIAPPVATATLPPTTETVVPTVAPTVAPAPVANGAELRIMSHDSFSISQEVIAAFEQQHGAKVTILPSGDAGTTLNKAILSKDAPIADLMFGVDNTFLSRALEADIFEPYASPALAGIADDLKIDSSNRLLPVDFGYVVINYDVNMLGTTDLIPYGDLRDLTRPEWKSKLVVQNPATSSPGLAFMLATIAKFGTEGEYTWLDYWRDLRANDVLVVDGWNDAYYTHFSGSSGQGPRPLVVSYATSPATNRQSERWCLPPDRVCRYSEGHPATRPGRAVCRFHAEQDLPRGHPTADVRLPSSA